MHYHSSHDQACVVNIFHTYWWYAFPQSHHSFSSHHCAKCGNHANGWNSTSTWCSVHKNCKGGVNLHQYTATHTHTQTYRYTGATAGESRVLACMRVLTKSRGWNMRVEATALRAPLEKATRTPWPLLSVITVDILRLLRAGRGDGTGRGWISPCRRRRV